MEEVVLNGYVTNPNRNSNPKPYPNQIDKKKYK
jgi:hypothetical protein